MILRNLKKSMQVARHELFSNRNAINAATPRLFIHIPKTAGTSFRSAAESRFGATRVLRDYGPDSEDTSQVLKDRVYGSGDPEALTSAIEEKGALLVSGHVSITKYRNVFGLADTATLIRNPVDQVVSHFRHMVRHYGYEGSLMEFARNPVYRNVQSQYIGVIDPALIGLVGLTESYRAFLNILNDQWGWNLRHRRRNVSNRFRGGVLEMSPEELREIERLNDQDVAIYRRAQQVFANRLKTYEQGLENDLRGGITAANGDQGVTGWALDMKSPTPVTVDVLVDGRMLAQVTCDQQAPCLSGWNLPVVDSAGFSIPHAGLDSRSVIELRDPVHGFVMDRRKLTGIQLPSD